MRWLPPSATTITPLEGITATPVSYWKKKLAAAPVPSAKAPLPLPASVLTTPLFGNGTGPPTTSASACGDVSCCASPAAPHSSTPAHVAGAAHLTHALALYALLPLLGSSGGALAPSAVK